MPAAAVEAKPNSQPKTGRNSNIRLRERLAPVLVVLPSIALIGLFVYGFIAWSGYVSLSKWNTLVRNLSFAGLENYRFLFQDFRFQSDLRNTLMFTLLFIATCLAIGLTLALLVHANIRFESLFRNLFIFPMALSFVVTGVAWQWILNPSTGVNLLLRKLGADDLPAWYTSTTVVPSISLGQIDFGLPVALLAVLIAAVWQLSGFTMAMFIAGLRAINEDIYEAARMDGATERQILRSITLPLLRPVTTSAVIILGHISLKIFDLIYAMTGPGAAFVTDVPGVYMFETTFRGNHYGQGSAIAIIMLLLVSILIVPYLISSMRKEEA